MGFVSFAIFFPGLNQLAEFKKQETILYSQICVIFSSDIGIL